MKTLALAVAFATALGACANAPPDLLSPVTANVEGAFDGRHDRRHDPPPCGRSG